MFKTATLEQVQPLSQTTSGVTSLYRIGAIAAGLQLVAIFGYGVVIALLGPKPTSAEEYFIIHQTSRTAAILRGDLLILVLIALYLGTIPALYVALRRISPVYMALASLFSILAVVGAMATEATFSLLHLGDLYATAATDAVRVQLVAAAEAVIAADMWNSTSAYAGGILLQGSGVMISWIMLRSRRFHKVTAYAGLLGNGFDLVQHILHPFAPSLSASISMFMGVFYFVWFPMLARDLWRLSRFATTE
jgi:hypothetical protein